MNSISDQVNGISDPAIVETIVREVMLRLSEMNSSAANARQPAIADQSQSQDSSQILELKVPVVTLEQLRGRLKGKKKLVVSSNAVVTPAVHDELRSLGIQLETDASTSQAEPAENSFCLARLSDHFVPVDWLKNIGLNQVCCGENYSELAKKLGSEFAQSKTICLAAQPYVAASILNRNQNLRAAFGHTEKDINEIRSTLNANVLVLESVQPRQELLQLIRLFTGTRSGSGTKVNPIRGAKK